MNLGAVLAEQHDEWTEARRNVRLEILATCRKGEKRPDANDADVTIDAIGA